MDNLEDLLVEDASKKEKFLFGLTMSSFLFTMGSAVMGVRGYETCLTTIIGGVSTGTSFLAYTRAYNERQFYYK